MSASVLSPLTFATFLDSKISFLKWNAPKNLQTTSFSEYNIFFLWNNTCPLFEKSSTHHRSERRTVWKFKNTGKRFKTASVPDV